VDFVRLAADNWCVKTNDRVYGPYSSAQLRKFAHEGLLAAWSLIAPAGSRAWREAREEKSFSSFFGAATTNPNEAGGERSFGKRDDAVETDADTTAGNGPRIGASAIKTKKDQKAAKAAQAPSGPANFIVVFDVVNAAASRVEAAMMSLGPAFLIADNVWTVGCELTAVGVRNAISPHLRPRESIFVVDSTHGRSSWQNYAPELHAKISAAWRHAKH